MMFDRWFQKPSFVPDPAETAELHATCKRIASQLKLAGYSTPALSTEPPIFPSDFHHRLDLLKLFAAALEEKPSSKNHKDLMWRFFGKMRMTPTSDVMDLIEDEDILEIYDMNGDQIFRNLNYFSVVSISVEDLVSMNWKRDFKRSAKVTLQLVELLLRFATGYFKKTFDCAKVPVHLVEETRARHNRIELNLKYISPLKQRGKCVAILVGSRCRLLSST